MTTTTDNPPTLDKQQIRKLMDSLEDERNGATLYEAMAKAEKDPRLAEIYGRFAAAEHRHAAAWAAKLAEAGVNVPAFRPSWRTKVLAFFARRAGVGSILPTVTGMEQAATGKYAAGDAAAADMAPEEASHARLLQQITGDVTGGLAGAQVARIEGRHRTGGGNALRAAVLGANDGLVSNLSLVMGVAGAAAELGSPHAILITGLAGLLAGSSSMALGEWLSVQSSRELCQRQLDIEKAEIESNPAEEAEELALIYQSRGVPQEQARDLAGRIFADREHALETLSREELGIDPAELGGSPWVAAGTSFVLFALGAVLPVIPFMFMTGTPAIGVSAGVSTLGLLGIGMATSLFTGRGAWRSGLRMVIFGLTAAAIIFGIGHFVGHSLA